MSNVIYVFFSKIVFYSNYIFDGKIEVKIFVEGKFKIT